MRATPFFEMRMRKEAILVGADLLACSGSVALALAVAFRGETPAAHSLPYYALLPVLASWRVIVARSFGLYDLKHRLTNVDHLFGGAGAALVGVGGGYMLLAFVQLYYATDMQLSRRVAVLDLSFLAIWFGVSRAVTLALMVWLRQRIRIVLVGPGAACRELSDEVRQYAPELIEVQGVIVLDEEDPDLGEALGAVSDIGQIAERESIDLILLMQPDLPQDRLRDLLAQCDRSGAEILLYPDLGLSILSNTQVMSIAGVPVISLRPNITHSNYWVGKRVLDIVSALLILTLCSPLCVAAAVGITLTSKGYIFYGQDRVGFRRKRFRLYKFRTMVEDAESTTGPVLSTSGDNRITPLGKWLRKARIDEIPQLWNVLRGDMSLVGPRPERADFFDEYARQNPLYERRVLVRPGLTGLAQIHGRYDTDYLHKLRYDLIYMNSVSLATDLRVLVATIRTVVTGKGAM